MTVAPLFMDLGTRYGPRGAAYESDTTRETSQPRPLYDRYIRGTSHSFTTIDGREFFINDDLRASQVRDGLGLGLDLHQIPERWHIGTSLSDEKEFSVYGIPTTLEPTQAKKDAWIKSNVELLRQQWDDVKRCNPEGDLPPTDLPSEVELQGALKWYLSLLRWITDLEWHTALLQVLAAAHEHIQNSHWTNFSLDGMDVGQSCAWVFRRAKHFLPQQDEWIPTSFERPKRFWEDPPKQPCNSLQYEDPVTKEIRYRTIVLLDDAAYGGTQGQAFVKKIRGELNLQSVPKGAKVKLFMGYGFASDAARECIMAAGEADARLDLTLVAHGHIPTVNQIISERSKSFVADLTSFETTEAALRIWVQMMHGPKQVHPAYPARKKWYFPEGLKMYTTVLSHKLPDEASLLWSSLAKRGLGGEFDEARYGLVQQGKYY